MAYFVIVYRMHEVERRMVKTNAMNTQRDNCAVNVTMKINETHKGEVNVKIKVCTVFSLGMFMHQ